MRILVKTAFIFVALNVAFALVNPLPRMGKISLYNWLLPGRERLPYGENASQSYNLSLNNLEAMFTSHTLAQNKKVDEFRVILLGDSSTWGFLLEPPDTLAGQLNAAGHYRPDGRRMVFYNLGYPIMSLTKDLLLLDFAMHYEPDMVIWLVTLESFPRDKQFFPPLVQNNPAAIRRLAATYDLPLDEAQLVGLDGWDRTIIGQRRALADMLRLQVYGIAWAATGIDQYYPSDYALRQSDFEEDISWHLLDEPQPLTDDYIAFDVLRAGVARVEGVPILLVNEPMFISDGRNSDLRYNFFYPRWVYDAWRLQLNELAKAEGWHWLDLWDAIEPSAFTDSPVHMTPAGTQQVANLIGDAIAGLP